MINEKVQKQFGYGILHNSCLKYSHSEGVLREMCGKAALRGNGLAIEIGTWNGLSTAIISEYFDVVHTFDIEKQKDFDAVITFLGRKNIVQHIIKDDDEKETLISELKKDCTFAFIDGDHWGEQPENDFNICRGIPFILFHDYNLPHVDVIKFIDSLPKKNKKITHDFALYCE